jgi:hypothetical protein
MIPGEKERLLTGVPNGESELPVKTVHTTDALVFIQMNDDFGIRIRVKPMTFGFQLCSQLPEVINLSVEDHPNRSVFVVNGLATAAQIDQA